MIVLKVINISTLSTKEKRSKKEKYYYYTVNIF